MAWIARNAPVLLLGAALAVAAAITLALTTDLTYFGDTWGLLMARRDLSVDAILHPHNEHLIAIPAALEILTLNLFGMDSARPGQLLLVVVLTVTAVLLYVYLARRVDRWLAAFGVVLILFLGPAWEVLLWPFEITFCGPVLFGIAMLLALDREDTPGDVAACAFLVLSLGFSSLGVPFIAGAAVAVLLGPRESWLRRSYVFVVPALLFLAWYAGWGHEAETHITLRNVLSSPQSVVDSAAVALGSLFGFVPLPVGPVADMSWPRAVLVGAVVVLAYRLMRNPRVPLSLWPVAATAAATWFLTAFPGRDPTASRYQYAGAIFVLMILANLFKGERLGRRGVLVAAAITALAVGPNLVLLRDGATIFEQQAVLARADTAAIEIARGNVKPEFQLDPEVAGTPSLVNVYAGEYFDATDEHGSPAYSPAELAGAPEAGRRQADIVLSRALPITRRALTSGRRPAGTRCRAVNRSAGRTEVPLRPGHAWVELSGGAAGELRLRRFAAETYPVRIGVVRAGAPTELRIPKDRASSVPWRLLVESTRTARVCQ